MITTIKMNTSIVTKHFLVSLCNPPHTFPPSSPLSLPLSQAITDLPSVTKKQCAFSGVLYKGRCTACTHFCLASFTHHNYLGFIHVVPCISCIPFCCWLVLHCMDILPFVERHLGCFGFGLLQIKLLWMLMYEFSCGHMLSISLRSGMSGSYTRCLFNILRNCQGAFQFGCAISHSHQQWVQVPVTPHSCPCLGWSVFKILAILIGT